MKVKINYKCGSCHHHGFCKYEEQCIKVEEKLDGEQQSYSDNLIATIDCEGFKDITKPSIKGRCVGV